MEDLLSIFLQQLAYLAFHLAHLMHASKWATIGLTKSLAMELGNFNIRVNAICPGSVSGDRMKRVIKQKQNH